MALPATPQETPDVTHEVPQLGRIKGVVVANEMQAVRRESGWQLDNLLGRLVEVSGHADTAALTFAVAVLLETQQRGESAAWISAVDSLFYPPDLAATGVDLEGLPIIRVEKGLQAARAADALIRSGGFGALIIDLGNQESMALSVQTRLAGLARCHNVAVLALTRRVQGGAGRMPSAGARRVAPGARRMRESQGSLGSLVSLWAETRRDRVATVGDPGGASSAGASSAGDWPAGEKAAIHFICELNVRKDKRCGDAWHHLEFCCGPDGLC